MELKQGDIQFDEASHTYTILCPDGQWRPALGSCTALIGAPFEQFDARQVAARMHRSGSLARKYPGETVDSVVALWRRTGDAAARIGTDLHGLIERHLRESGSVTDWCFGPAEAYAHVQKELGFFQDFWRLWRPRLRRWWPEVRVCVPAHAPDAPPPLAGSVDFLGECVDGRYVLMDWKRSKDLQIKSPVPKYGLEQPFRSMRGTKFNKYSLQVHLYAEILQRYYGIPVHDLYIVVFHPDNDTFEEVRAADVRHRAQYLLETLGLRDSANGYRLCALDDDWLE